MLTLVNGTFMRSLELREKGGIDDFQYEKGGSQKMVTNKMGYSGFYLNLKGNVFVFLFK